MKYMTSEHAPSICVAWSVKGLGIGFKEKPKVHLFMVNILSICHKKWPNLPALWCLISWFYGPSCCHCIFTANYNDFSCLESLKLAQSLERSRAPPGRSSYLGREHRVHSSQRVCQVGGLALVGVLALGQPLPHPDEEPPFLPETHCLKMILGLRFTQLFFSFFWLPHNLGSSQARDQIRAGAVTYTRAAATTLSHGLNWHLHRDKSDH